MRLIHAWRIPDDTRRWSELVSEARYDLIRYAHTHGLHIHPGGRFEVITSHGVEPARLFLIAHIDVEAAA